MHCKIWYYMKDDADDIEVEIEVISQKPSKNWIFDKMAIFGQKNPQFWIFPRVPLLTHTSRHLGEDFRKFSAKTNDKNWSY